MFIIRKFIYLINYINRCNNKNIMIILIDVERLGYKINVNFYGKFSKGGRYFKGIKTILKL